MGVRTIEQQPAPRDDDLPSGVFLVEESRVVRAALRRLLGRAGPYPVVGEAADLTRVLPRLTMLRPRILVLDPFAGPVVSAAWLHGVCSAIDASAIVTTFDEERAADELSCDGFVRGIVSKESDPDEILRALRAVRNGESYVCSRILRLRETHPVS